MLIALSRRHLARESYHPRLFRLSLTDLLAAFKLSASTSLSESSGSIQWLKFRSAVANIHHSGRNLHWI